MKNNTINPRIFRAYDIRGHEGIDLNPETAVLFGKSYGTYIQSIQKEKPDIIVGRDNRLSSKKLQEFFIKGLLSTCANVIDIGLSLSPMVYFSVFNWDYDGGVNVTASHNPIGYNGFKMIKKKSFPVAEDEIQIIRSIIESRKFKTGSGSYLKKNIKNEYFDFIKREVKLQRPLKAVIDAGNGTAGLFAPELVKSLGCEVIELYCNSDGTFPNHHPDPEDPKNMKDLSIRVVKEKADIGIAFDGDGDRIGFVDENGKIYPADILIALLAKNFLEKNTGEKILLDVKCSQSVIDFIKTHNGVPILYKTGHSLIKKKMREENILLGGELSGHILFGGHFNYIDDALLAASILLKILSKSKIKLSELLKDFPSGLSTNEIKIPCKDDIKFEIVEKIREYYIKKYPDSITIDGIRINFPNGWALIRASNTDSNLTVRIEAKTEDDLSNIKHLLHKKLIEFPALQIPDELQ